MAKLVVNPGAPNQWEIQLKPGTNTLGRGFANDFKIEDPSVSGSHCQLVLGPAGAVIKDLGSTNGTYVNRSPVKEATLLPGQSIHLGGVEMVFYADAPVSMGGVAAPVRIATAVAAPVAVAVAAPRAAPPVAVAVARPPGLAIARPAHAQTTAVALPASEPPAIPVAAPAAVAGGPHQCKFHPKTAARFFCAQCGQYFCDLCVTSRQVGQAMHKFCRHCGVECSPVQVQVVRKATGTKGFFGSLPGAFGYPLKGSGVLILIIAAIVFAALNFISGGGLPGGPFGIILWAAATGYLFSFMQNIIHATASEEPEMPGMPDFDELFGAFFRLLGAVMIAFGPAIGLLIFNIFAESPAAGQALIPVLVLGAIYFPMALLAVAMKDSALAANPLIVIPAIFKVPLPYLVTLIVLAATLGARYLGDMMIEAMFPKGLTTHSMGELAALMATRAFWSLAGIYLLTVTMHILGLLYVHNKHRLGWTY